MVSQAGDVEIHGAVTPGFESVRDAFADNFRLHGERGASVAVYAGGQQVVDLWGGTAGNERPWERDTIAIVYSVTKGATSVVCNLLAQRGELDMDAPVAQYWPEFAANGKSEVTVRMLLSHQAGLPVIDAQLTRAELLAGAPVTAVLEGQAPAWAPGTGHGYHGLTFGWLVGELVRRATGRTVGQVLAADVAEPLGLDFHIGLPLAEEPRVAPLIDAPPPDPRAFEVITDPELLHQRVAMAAMADPTSLLRRAATLNGALPTPSAEHWNGRDIHEVEQPAVNGITNARSVARMYAACVAEVDGVRLLTPATVCSATQEMSAGTDLVTGFQTRFGTGFALPTARFRAASEASFGHLGAGGALGFADVERKLGFGYVQNQLAVAPGGDRRRLGLLAALQESLGD